MMMIAVIARRYAVAKGNASNVIHHVLDKTHPPTSLRQRIGSEEFNRLGTPFTINRMPSAEKNSQASTPSSPPSSSSATWIFGSAIALSSMFLLNRWFADPPRRKERTIVADEAVFEPDTIQRQLQQQQQQQQPNENSRSAMAEDQPLLYEIPAVSVLTPSEKEADVYDSSSPEAKNIRVMEEMLQDFLKDFLSNQPIDISPPSSPSPSSSHDDELYMLEQELAQLRQRISFASQQEKLDWQSAKAELKRKIRAKRRASK